MLKLRRVNAIVLLALALVGTATAGDVQGRGVVKAVDARAGTVTVAHERIESIGWPAMTMPFKVASPALLERVTAGTRVQFTLVSGTDTRIDSLKVLE